MGRPAYPVVKWQVTGTTTPLVKCDGNQLVGFITGPTLSSTTMTFNDVSSFNQSATPVPIKNSAGTAISFTVTTNSYYGFSQDQTAQFTGVEVFQFVGGASETAGTTIQPIFIPRQY